MVPRSDRVDGVVGKELVGEKLVGRIGLPDGLLGTDDGEEEMKKKFVMVKKKRRMPDKGGQWDFNVCV